MKWTGLRLPGCMTLTKYEKFAGRIRLRPPATATDLRHLNFSTLPPVRSGILCRFDPSWIVIVIGDSESIRCDTSVARTVIRPTLIASDSRGPVRGLPEPCRWAGLCGAARRITGYA
jgi:hypothetical protein